MSTKALTPEEAKAQAVLRFAEKRKRRAAAVKQSVGLWTNPPEWAGWEWVRAGCKGDPYAEQVARDLEADGFVRAPEGVRPLHEAYAKDGERGLYYGLPEKEFAVREGENAKRLAELGGKVWKDLRANVNQAMGGEAAYIDEVPESMRAASRARPQRLSA